MTSFMTTARYADAWHEYRRRRQALYVTLAGGLVVMLANISIINLTGTLPPWIVAIWLLFGIPHIVVGFRFTLWRCPRCSKPFHSKGLHQRILATKCLNCGLPQWAEGPEVEQR
jgi:hypothetical protein